MNIKSGVNDIEVIPAGITTREFMKIKTQSTDKEDCDNPFYILDIKRLVDRYKLWTETFPLIKPFYAVKCNCDSVVLSTLAYLGAGFDCASKNEILQVLNLRVSPCDIIFANPCKQISHIQYASEQNVSLMTFDNTMELYKIAANYNKAKLVVRIKADDPHAKLQLGIKFGCTVSEACQMLNVAMSLNLNVVGVSFHVGSGCVSPDAYRIALEMSHEVFQYADTIGYHLTLLDIGGGFPGTNNEKLPLFAACINENIEKLFSTRNDIEIIAEPAVQVTSKRICDKTSDVEFMYYVTDGMHGSFNEYIYDPTISRPVPLKDVSNTDNVYHSCYIWGPTCSHVDKICQISLPELNIEDWIYFDNMGAYTMSLHSEFNGFKCPIVFYYIREEDRCDLEKALTACNK